jgi:hypothetical protein
MKIKAAILLILGDAPGNLTHDYGYGRPFVFQEKATVRGLIPMALPPPSQID